MVPPLWVAVVVLLLLAILGCLLFTAERLSEALRILRDERDARQRDRSVLEEIVAPVRDARRRREARQKAGETAGLH